MVSKWAEITKEDVDKAIIIYNKDPDKYAKNQAKSTFLIYDGVEYPAKAIRRIAYEVHFNEQPDEKKFSGGFHTKNFFEKIGFKIRYEPSTSQDTQDKVNYWLYLPGNEAKKWEDLLEKGIIGLQFIEIGDLSQYKTKKEITNKFQEVYGDEVSHKNDVMAYWDFVKNMKIGDIIYVKKGNNQLIGKGIVKSDYVYNTEIDNDFNHIRYVDWEITGEWTSEKNLPPKTLTNITKYEDFLNYIIKLVEPEYVDFISYLNSKNYYFEKEMIENFLLSLKVKPFVILTGNSGTGKTKLAQLFAQYLYDKLGYNEEVESNYALVAVGANWTDNRNIIGYYNSLLSNLEETPTSKLINKANDDLDHPYFLILDEMNLSYVERYFSDFLSALESGEKMDIPGASGADELSDDEKQITLPSNLFVVGTVNVDETTYMFSPKVLDRANVLEFNTVPVNYYMDSAMVFNYDDGVNIGFLEDPLCHESFKKDTKDNREIERIDIKFLKEKFHEIDNSDELWDKLKDDLTGLHEILQESGFDFGFRVTNEILSFICEASIYERDLEYFNWERYLDAQIIQKVLPKLHGSKTQIEDTLNDLYKFCSYPENIDESNENISLTVKKYRFDSSAEKIIQMLKDLDKSRYVSFIG